MGFGITLFSNIWPVKFYIGQVVGQREFSVILTWLASFFFFFLMYFLFGVQMGHVRSLGRYCEWPQSPASISSLVRFSRISPLPFALGRQPILFKILNSCLLMHVCTYSRVLKVVIFFFIVIFTWRQDYNRTCKSLSIQTSEPSVCQKEPA